MSDDMRAYGGRPLTFGQAAARLGIGVTTVAAWARCEQCPVIRDGRRRRVPAEWVDELIANGWR